MLNTLITVSLLCSQASENAKSDNPPSKVSIAYREYREAITEPTFGLSKVKKLIKGIREDKEGNLELPSTVFEKLSFKEKFTYHMIHGEAYSQNCDVMPIFEREEQRIFGFIPSAFSNEHSWSERQRDFFSKNRSQMIGAIRETLRIRKRAGVNLKNAVLELNAVELIPDLIAVYKRREKDHDVLTSLNLLMKENKYPPFLKSSSFEKLYGEHLSYWSSIEANSANKKLVIDRATAFYQSKKK